MRLCICVCVVGEGSKRIRGGGYERIGYRCSMSRQSAGSGQT